MIIEDDLDMFVVEFFSTINFEVIINRQCDGGMLPLSRAELEALRYVCDKALNIEQDEIDAA